MDQTLVIPLNFAQLAVVAFFVESLVQTFKPLHDRERGFNLNVILALAVGILVCVLTGTDIFKQVGLTISVPIVGPVLTGIIASRGSNVAHDLFKFLERAAHPAEIGPVG